MSVVSRTPLALGWAGGALVLAMLVAGCGGSGGSAKLSEGSTQAAYPAGPASRQPSEAAVLPRPVAAPARCSASVASVGSTRLAYAAFVKTHAVVRTAPRARSPVVRRLARLNGHGLREVVGVIGVHSSARCAPDWYQVRLSVLPNGTTGWVRASEVHTYRVRARIVVDLSERLLRLYRSGRLALEASVAVGSSATPTPVGRYFVNERYVLPDASGPFGPNALGISAHSEALQRVWVENGPIAIHGTNEPWSIGRAASHGCIRVANDAMRQLFRLAPAGTPVVVET